MTQKNLIVALSLVGLLSCKKESGSFTYSPENKDVGVNTKLIDYNTDPKADFFQFVNGKWLAENEIPSDRTRWGSFDELRKNTDKDVLAIIDELKSQSFEDTNSEAYKIISLYKSVLDLETRNRNGISELTPYLDQIQAIDNFEKFMDYAILSNQLGFGNLFGFYVGADAKDSNKNSLQFGGGSLGLPDRDYYVKDDEETKAIREKYVAHMTKMLQYLGNSETEANLKAKSILDFETRLAEAKMDKVERRDATKRYNPRSWSDFKVMMPNLNWDKYMTEVGVSVDTLIVSDLNYVAKLKEELNTNNFEPIKAYLEWSLLNGASSRLSEDLDQSNWEFYSKELKGAKEQRPLDERALSTLNRALGEALGKIYVSNKFPPEAKTKAKDMISNVLLAFENRIEALPWMSEATKQKAIEKLRATKVKVGYPDKWKDYSKLNIKAVEDQGSYFSNMVNLSKWNFDNNIADLSKPVDKSEWYMAPQVVNAYFNPSYNEIVFPAAILQPPFYDFKADEAVNYGGIGAVIGHEISHSFDDSGARYDKDGNLNNWWTDADLEKFTALGNKLADQYSQVELLPNTSINGKFTLGENIGDLGGVNAAYDGLMLHFKENGRPDNIDGFTPEQRFFMSWATVWRTKYTDEALKNQVKTDPHSPGMVRATQPLINIDTFYDAFNITEQDKMYIDSNDRVKIW